MEIHTPHHPVLSFRDGLVHLFIVTAGIVIALSFEGVLEWRQHRALVRETRVRVTNELRSNQESIQTVLKSLGPTRARLVKAIDIASYPSTPEKTKEAATMFGEGTGNVLSGLSFAYFNTAAYTTATMTGAFGFMEYGEAVRYADVYDLQTLYSRMQDIAERDLIAATMLGTSVVTKPTVTEVEEVRRQIRLALGGLLVMESIATKLDKLYTEALKP
jgi:hypothetical protein